MALKQPALPGSRHMAILAIMVLALGCSSCSTPSTPTQPTVDPSVRFPDLKAIAGTYTLTIDLDDACSTLPAAARHRVYSARLEDRGWHFLVVGVVGGGFSELTELGDLFSGELSPVQEVDPRLRWNVFDLSCDVKEPLADSTELALCGEGPIRQSGSSLSGALNGMAVLFRGATGLARCQGEHRFVFER